MCFPFMPSRNDFSKWLNARAIFPVAQLFKYIRNEDFQNLDDIRVYLYEAISSYRISKSRGIIAKFDKNSHDSYRIFSRIGDESIGGKARGLAFINSVIDKHNLYSKFDNVVITVPKTVVLSTDVFDEFMEMNDLYHIGISDLGDEEILDHFVDGQAAGLAAPGPLHGDFGVPGSHCHTFLQQAGRFTLSAFCRNLLHLYDPGKQGGSLADHGDAYQRHQIGLRLGLFQGEQGLYRGHLQCH